MFTTRCPTIKQLHRKRNRRKRNNAAPGFDMLSYLPFKKCVVLMEYVHVIAIKVWTTQDVPECWALAYIILLAKSNNLTDCAEFRPIAITGVIGKIIFSVLSDNLQKYMLQNAYIDREVQKGFLTGISGCLEHSFALHEALKEAKSWKKSIVVTWIDLANAYGSVRHNLIQFALEWYGVPALIRKLIFKYYELLMAKVITKNWSLKLGFFKDVSSRLFSLIVCFNFSWIFSSQYRILALPISSSSSSRHSPGHTLTIYAYLQAIQRPTKLLWIP